MKGRTSAVALLMLLAVWAGAAVPPVGGTPSPGPAQEGEGRRSGAEVLYEVLEVDELTSTIDVQRVVGPGIPAGADEAPRTMLLDTVDYRGRMETQYGFPVTIHEIEPGMRMRVFFDGEGEVEWIIVEP